MGQQGQAHLHGHRVTKVLSIEFGGANEPFGKVFCILLESLLHPFPIKMLHNVVKCVSRDIKFMLGCVKGFVHVDKACSKGNEAKRQ